MHMKCIHTQEKHRYEYYIFYRKKFRKKNLNLFDIMSNPEPDPLLTEVDPDSDPDLDQNEVDAKHC